MIGFGLKQNQKIKDTFFIQSKDNIQQLIINFNFIIIIIGYLGA